MFETVLGGAIALVVPNIVGGSRVGKGRHSLLGYAMLHSLCSQCLPELQGLRSSGFYFSTTPDNMIMTAIKRHSLKRACKENRSIIRDAEQDKIMNVIRSGGAEAQARTANRKHELYRLQTAARQCFTCAADVWLATDLHAAAEK